MLPRILPPVMCWTIVPINVALATAFLFSLSSNNAKWSLYLVYLLLCFVQIAAGIATISTSASKRTPEQRTTEKEPETGRFTLGVIGTILGIIELLLAICGVLGLARA